MELNKNEHSILCYFPSSSKANKAAEELQNAGLVPGKGYIQIDRISPYEVVNDSYYYNALTLNYLTNYSNNEWLEQDINPLLTINVSGSGWGVNDDSRGKAILVTLVTDKNNVEQAVQIMKSNGGFV